MAKSLHLFMLLYLLQSNFSYSVNNELDDCSLLLDFKNNISTNKFASIDPHSYPKLASWNHNTSAGNSYCCLWDGVECSRKTAGHVVVLDLSSSFLYGTINSTTTLFSLIHLRTLNLADNDFRSSQIPPVINRLSQLTNLNLSYCGFTGQFPTSIFRLEKLQLLDVQGNIDLTGYLPKFHGNTQLKLLILAETNFHGKVTPSIGNLVHLESLDLHSCSFFGHLPGSVSNLTQLRFMNLQNNSLWGRIPSLASLSKLGYLKLSFNQFDGRNLSEWLGKLPDLSYLDLQENNISCEIPFSIGNQTQLRELYLNNNNMVGRIPSSIMNLTHLTHVRLGLNGFTGTLPSLESLSNLTYLSLSRNHFDRWKLYDWFGKLNKLTYLDLHAASLYGEIPTSIFNLTQVGDLILSLNQIEGPIPHIPTTMTKLTRLDLEHNRLRGPIPSSLLNLENLEVIRLNDNNISGTVDIHIFLSLKKLKVLDLGRNRITLLVINNHTDTLPEFEIIGLDSCNLRVFPEFLRFQNQLQELYLKDNKIDGMIPEWMGNTSKDTLEILILSKNSLIGFQQHSTVVLPWVGLLILDLSHNMLHGSIPVPPPTMRDFLVSNNKLTGEIPPSICDLQSLRLLDLSFNNINGTITPCFENLTNSLLVLNLRSNTLCGTIPITSFTNGSKLRMIDLSDNQLEGQLSRSLENCVSLEILDLGNNYFEDAFPFWLGSLSELQVLILRSNKFHGTISIPSKANSMFRKLRIIDISYNSFYGDLPHQYFEEWSAMKKTESDAEYMRVNDTLQNGLGFWNYSYSVKLINKGVKMEYNKIIDILISVDLSSNKFRGKIPVSITSLSCVRLLNLSNNELSGAIPSSMGNLTLLEALDLSSNKLSGKIPQELSQLNFLELLNVSYNNLTGPIPQGRQLRTFMNISYIGNIALCGDPLSKKCGNSKVSTPPQTSNKSESFLSSEIRVDWIIILSGVAGGLVVGIVIGNILYARYSDWFIDRFEMRKSKWVWPLSKRKRNHVL